MLMYQYHTKAEDKKGNVCWCLVLMKGNKSFRHITDSECIAGRGKHKLLCYEADLARATKHMHDSGTIHTDIKPRNAIRVSDGDIILFDLDATVQAGEGLSGKKKITAYISPEVARVEFQVQETLEHMNKEYNIMLNEKIFGC